MRLEGALKLVLGAPKLCKPFAQHPAELRQLFRTKQQKRKKGDNKHLLCAERAHLFSFLMLVTPL
jgi:hypothetical protein